MLQELRGCHPQLLEFLCTEETVSRLIDCIASFSPTQKNGNVSVKSSSSFDDDADGIEYVTVAKEDGQQQLEDSSQQNVTSSSSSSIIDVEESALNHAEEELESKRLVLGAVSTKTYLAGSKSIEVHELETSDDTTYQANTAIKNLEKDKLSSVIFNGIQHESIAENINDSDGIISTPSCIQNAVIISENGEANYINETLLPGASSTTSSEIDENGMTEEDRLLRFIRYPFMATEILCCNNPQIVQTFLYGTYQKQKTSSSFMDININSNDNNTNFFAQMDDVGIDSDLLHNSKPTPATIEEEDLELKKGCVVPSTGSILETFVISMLSLPSSDLTDRMAGYLEKVLTSLSYSNPEIMICLRGGSDSEESLSKRKWIMERICCHIGRYSVVQILLRILLPPPSTPSLGQGLYTTDIDNDDTEEIPCLCLKAKDDDATISYVLTLLVDKLCCNFRKKKTCCDSAEDYDDTARHCSEVLMTLIQSSSLNSLLLRKLTTNPLLDKIATRAKSTWDEEAINLSENPCTYALHILEMIILQLAGSAVQDTTSSSTNCSSKQTEKKSLLTGADDRMIDVDESAAMVIKIDNQSQLAPRKSVATISHMETLLPGLLASLHSHLILPYSHSTNSADHSLFIAENIVGEDKIPAINGNDDINNLPQTNIPLKRNALRLGASRLRVIQFVEACVIINSPIIDALLVKTEVISKCVDLFFEFEQSSMLHQSVANMIFNAINTRWSRGNEEEGVLALSKDEEHISINTVSFEKNDAKALITNSGRHGLIHCLFCTCKLPKKILVAFERNDELLNKPSTTENLQNPFEGDKQNLRIDTEKNSNISSGVNDIIHNISLTKDGSKLDKLSERVISGASSVKLAHRLGYIGHLLIICQAIVHACSEESEDEANKADNSIDLENRTVESNSDDIILSKGVVRAISDEDDSGIVVVSMSPEITETDVRVDNDNSDDEGMIEQNQSSCHQSTGNGISSNFDSIAVTSMPLQSISSFLSLPKIIEQNLDRNSRLKWKSFVNMRLKEEIRIQTTPLCSENTSNENNVTMFNQQMEKIHNDMTHSLNQSNQDVNIDHDLTDALESSAEVITSNDAHEVLEMNDAELDVAVSMISEQENATINATHVNTPTLIAGAGMVGVKINGFSSSSASNLSGGSGYYYEDPLGGSNVIDEHAEVLNPINSEPQWVLDDEEDGVRCSENSADDDSSDEEDAEDKSGECPRVMDLFAGNFYYGDENDKVDGIVGQLKGKLQDGADTDIVETKSCTIKSTISTNYRSNIIDENAGCSWEANFADFDSVLLDSTGSGDDSKQNNPALILESSCNNNHITKISTPIDGAENSSHEQKSFPVTSSSDDECAWDANFADFNSDALLTVEAVSTDIKKSSSPLFDDAITNEENAPDNFFADFSSLSNGDNKPNVEVISSTSHDCNGTKELSDIDRKNELCKGDADVSSIDDIFCCNTGGVTIANIEDLF